MKNYLLDTNVVIDLLRGAAKGSRSPLFLRLHRESPESVAISSIVLHELYYGAFKSRRIEYNVALLDNLRFEVLALEEEDARAAGEIRAALAKRGIPVGPYDVLIAGQAKARNRILVTHNLREFQRIDGLVAEDWTKG